MRLALGRLVVCMAAWGFFPVHAQIVFQWGEAPSGAGTRGTNIVVPPNRNIVFTNRSLLMTYTGITNNPGVHPTNYYPDALGRSPYFSAAVSDSSIAIGFVGVVENANSGDRITIYGGSVPPGGSYRGMVMWPSDYYYTSRIVVIRSMALAINQRLNSDTVSQQVRLVLQSSDSFYVNDAVSFGATTITQSYDLANENWHPFTPFVSGAEIIGGGIVTPNFSNVQAVGYYFSAVNGASTSGPIGAQVQFFRAEGTANTIPTLTTWGLIILAILALFFGSRRLQCVRA